MTLRAPTSRDGRAHIEPPTIIAGACAAFISLGFIRGDAIIPRVPHFLRHSRLLFSYYYFSHFLSSQAAQKCRTVISLLTSPARATYDDTRHDMPMLITIE